jgi:leucyl/phenylalanyl-tRNA---protein transferase
MLRRATKDEPPFPYLSEDMDFAFPDPGTADKYGVVCSGGNLSPGLLLSAYRRGIFPWFSEDEPILWWSPDPRFVLFPEELHVSGTMRKILRKRPYELRLDGSFPAVIRACSASPRPGQSGTWITDDMIEAYGELHRLGYAHSAEAWLRPSPDAEPELVGGLYGVALGSIFFGESMFSRLPDASKAAFIPLVWRLREEGFTLIDSQVYTDHLAGLGAREIPRIEYLRLLANRLANEKAVGAAPTRKGDWSKLFPDFPLSSEYRRVVLKETD